MQLHEVDEHLDSAENSAILATDTATKGFPDLCVIYGTVRPVLKFARALLFFKPKWQKAIDLLTDNLDLACNI